MEPHIPPAPRWTPARQRIFLAALLDHGSVAHAAQLAGMSRASASRLRARLAGSPFDRDWSLALAGHARRCADPFAPDPAAAPLAPRAALDAAQASRC